MRQSAIPIILGTTGGAVASAAFYNFMWRNAFPGGQGPLETFGLVLTAFTGAVFGGLGASVDQPPGPFSRVFKDHWRLWLAVTAMLVVEVLTYWIIGSGIHRWDRYSFIILSFLLGYLIRRAYDTIVGGPTSKGPLNDLGGSDEGR